MRYNGDTAFLGISLFGELSAANVRAKSTSKHRELHPKLTIVIYLTFDLRLRVGVVKGVASLREFARYAGSRYKCRLIAL